MKSNKRYYWDKIYKKISIEDPPSSFAKFCIKSFIKKSKNKKILDIGCGNGRDLIFFSKYLQSFGIDKSNTAINILKRKYKKNKNISLKRVDLKNLNPITLGKYDYLYMRFLLHAVDLKIQNKLLKNLKKIMKKGAIAMCEFRTDKDPLKNFGKKISKNETYTDHYRRFINYKDFLKTLKICTYKVIFKTERRGLSIYKKDNPVLGRIIFKNN